MKKIISYLTMILIWAACGLNAAGDLPYSTIISPKCVKMHSTFETRIKANVNQDSSKTSNSILTPKIHQGIWPDFCVHHLQNDPEGCSTWGIDEEDKLQLDFALNGHSECQIDRNLLHRLGHHIYLIPQKASGYKGCCDYASCPNCSQTVIRALSYYEEDEDEDGNEIDGYTYFPVYRCGCTGAWWLDLDNLCNEDCEIYEGWQFCNAPTIYHGYPDWHHQSYFSNLKAHLTYIEENPKCDCYWPQVNVQAKEISNLAYLKLLSALDTSSLDNIRNSFTPYLIERSQHGFLSGLLTNTFFYSHYRDILLDFDQHSFKEKASDYLKIHNDLIDLEESLQKPFLNQYSQCLAKHPHPKIYYERGMLLFHRADNLDSLEDIRRFIAYAEKNKYQTFLTSDLYLKEGRLLSESLSYDEAIIALTKAIEKDPKNAEAFFDRAIAYFETGNFEMALSDYLASGIRPKKVDPKKIGKLNYVTLSQGIALGMLQGGQDSVTEFVPSLLSCCHGINKGLWAFVSNPIAISQDLIDSAYACIEFIKDNTSKEVLCKLVPELQECLAKWNQLNDYTKGKYIGHIIGKYGVDIFVGAGSLKAIKLYRNLRKANSLMTLETAFISPKLAQEVLELAAKEEAIRNKILKSGNLKVQWDKQGKHIKGHKNYMPEKNKSIFTHENPQKLIDEYAGTGRKYGSNQSGLPGYKEDVNFQQIIGQSIDQTSGTGIKTTWGRIHYAKDGVHIVPIKPRN